MLGCDFENNNNWSLKNVVEKLEKLIGITIIKRYYGMIEKGVRTSSLEVALAISEVFEMRLIKIFLRNKTTKCCVYKDPNGKHYTNLFLLTNIITSLQLLKLIKNEPPLVEC